MAELGLMRDSKITRVETTLFMLVSVDGKITSGETDELDPDGDWKRVNGVKEGLNQYYEIEQTTDLYSLNSGRVMAKIGVNTRIQAPKKSPVSFFIIDRKPHLTESGLEYLCDWVKKLYLVSNNKAHPAFGRQSKLDNLEVLYYAGDIDLAELLVRMKQEYGIERLTIQSGGTLNSQFLRQGLIDHISLVVAPLLVGGQATPSLIGGYSLRTEKELSDLKALKLISCSVLKNSYIRLEYDVIQETKIDAKI